MPTSDYDLVIRGGTLASAAEVSEADIGIKDGLIAALGRNLSRGVEEISARGMVVTPGGLDSHCHIEKFGQDGSVQEESFATGSAAALSGGTTSFNGASCPAFHQPKTASNPSIMARCSIASVIVSRTCLPSSRTGTASQPDTTDALTRSSPPSASLRLWRSTSINES